MELEKLQRKNEKLKSLLKYFLIFLDELNYRKVPRGGGVFNVYITEELYYHLIERKIEIEKELEGGLSD